MTTPTPYYDHAGVTIYHGDALTVLNQLPEGSVHMCVTSPPYWGLRDYGTASWEGGDDGCDHKQEQPNERLMLGSDGKPGKNCTSWTYRDSTVAASDTCRKCGAKRIDSQIGLEATPEEFVAKMVEVFRGVRRVLRGDGCAFINLGSSYASGDINPSQSPLLTRVPACGSDGKAPQDSQGDGRACLDSCDEHQGETQSRRGCTARNDQSEPRGAQQPLQTIHDSEHSGCASEAQRSSPSGAPASRPPASCHESPVSASTQPHEPDGHETQQTAQACGPPSEHTADCTSGNSSMLPPLVVRTQGKESFFSACHRSDCKGVGRCGLCWCSLSIPSLNVKPKDEMNMPHLVAMALQADGWVLRQTIIWSKPNPMPESVTDRCTKSHEYLFLLSKSARYYFDAEAIKEPATYAGHGRGGSTNRYEQNAAGMDSVEYSTRNKRSVWTVNPKSFPGAHFATYPPKLIEPCIKAGTSERGCCPKCLAPWVRVVERVRPERESFSSRGQMREENMRQDSDFKMSGQEYNALSSTKTIGWQPTCKCDAGDPVPCTVLDPFLGSGVSAEVARNLGCKAIGIELNAKYIALCAKRLAQDVFQFGVSREVDGDDT